MTSHSPNALRQPPSPEQLRHAAMALMLASFGTLALLGVGAALRTPEHARGQGAWSDGSRQVSQDAALQALQDRPAPSAEQPARSDRAPSPSTAGLPPAKLAAQPAQDAMPRTAARVLAEAEFGYGPPVKGFDTAAFLATRPGALKLEQEATATGNASGATIVEQVARDHSLSPRVLLALIELESGLVDGQGRGASASAPSGRFGAPSGNAGIQAMASGIAVQMDRGYYGYKYRGLRTLRFADGREAAGQADQGAAHFALARYLALTSSGAAQLVERLGAFAAVYSNLFGGIEHAEPVIPDGLVQPPLLVPWVEGETWRFTGGPHGSWGIDTAWGAIDFAPPTPVGCGVAPEWVVASAPGVVVRSETGHVAVDLDEDNFEGTGWVITYFHMADEGRARLGTHLEPGDHVGHPSCRGGKADGAHVHFMRRFDGEWLPAAGGPVPLDLSGWRFTSSDREYDGTMVNDAIGTRFAGAGRVAGPMAVDSDNGPTRRAALAEAWRAQRTGPVVADAMTADRVASAARQVEDAAPSADARRLVPTAAAIPQSARPSEVNAWDAWTQDALFGAAARDTSTSFEKLGSKEDGSQVARSPIAPSGTIRATIGLTVTLEGRRSYATQFILGLVRGAGEQPVIVMGQTNARGQSGPIQLPDLPPGRYTLTFRAPGYLPLPALFDLQPGYLQVDLSGGGTAPLRQGDFTGDDAVGWADFWAWATKRSAAGPDGTGAEEGRDRLADLRRLLANWSRQASAGE